MLRLIRTRRRGGFTLIEIMVVILIIGVLLAIAFPVFGKARDTARTKTCIRNLREISDAKEQYTMEARKKEGDAVSFANLVPTYLRKTPECPAGGTYDIQPAGENPTCTIEGHEL
ncbi:MAG TPA: type II secretion system protein [Armatimonadota bacterium]|nr:type II secretion system protein [Armatimonadota bacterium]